LPDINGRSNGNPNAGGSAFGNVATAERQAINTVIQGSASELIKVAMVLVQSRINSHPRWRQRVPKLLMQIHDELIYEVPVASEDDIVLVTEEFVAILRECMEQRVADFFHLSVPLIVNIQTSDDSWGTFKKLSITRINM